MDDKELIELAAKAAGEDVEWHDSGSYFYRKSCNWPAEKGFFNPLHDDGEALRLAAKLVLNVLASEACILAEDENGVECIEYMYGPEDYTSGWRRAIVRAAAEIGRTK